MELLYYMTDGKPSEIEVLKGTEIEEYMKLVKVWEKKIKLMTPKKK